MAPNVGRLSIASATSAAVAVIRLPPADTVGGSGYGTRCKKTVEMQARHPTGVSTPRQPDMVPTPMPMKFRYHNALQRCIHDVIILQEQLLTFTLRLL